MRHRGGAHERRAVEAFGASRLLGTFLHDRFDGRGRLEHHIHILASALRTHQAAAEPSKRKAATLRPHQRLHVELGFVFAFSQADRGVHDAANTAHADAPAKPVSLAKGLD